MLAVSIAGCGFAHAAVVPATDMVTKGKYLSNAGDCMSCHTAVNGKPFAGGLVMQTPFGPLTTPNITPDKQTGIGNWSDDDFYRLMHEGIGEDGGYIYPVMPFPWYTIVSREDVLAIKAYLFSLPPVPNPRPPNTLKFPFNIRQSLVAWREAFFKPGEFKPDSTQSDPVNRGSYLVNGLAHCGECHNAHPSSGTSRFNGSLEGGVVESWYAPNISSDVRTGIGAWTDAELVKYLKTGSAPGKGVAVGPMAEVVRSLSRLSDEDVKAIAAYLKTTPPKVTDKRASDPPVPFARGAEVYLDNCASCHGIKGEGQDKVIPALRANPVVLTEGPQNVISVVLNGLGAKDTYAPMLAIGAGMSDEDVADAVNYVRQSWGNAAPATATSGMVAKLRGSADSLMSATQCVIPVADRELAKTLAGPEVHQQLAALSEDNMAVKTPALVRTARARSAKISNADLVNALTAALCPLVNADKTLNATQKSLKIGHFAQYVYMDVAAGRR